MNLTRGQMLAEIGIAPLWGLRCRDGVVRPSDRFGADSTPDSPAAAAAGVASAPAASGTSDWEGLEKEMAGCRACPLAAHRRQVVPGVGDRRAEWLLIGEGPGAEEDVKGEPFVGQAGKLLDNMLAAIGLRRGEKVYIANAVKCRPPGNRTPEPEEISACFPFLDRQIGIINPRLIVLLGRSAAHSVLREERGSLGSLRGRRFEYKGIPVVVTYHPAYLLRNLPEKLKAWEDLLFARRVMEQANNPALF